MDVTGAGVAVAGVEDAEEGSEDPGGSVAYLRVTA